MELRILLREWFARIPEFRLAEGAVAEFTSGIVGAVNPFVLECDA